MKVKKAVITAAGEGHRSLPLQRLVDRDGREKSVLCILVEEVLSAGIEEIAVIIPPGDAKSFAAAASDHAKRLDLIEQKKACGYGGALQLAAGFTGDEPFLHMVGDHLYVSRSEKSCAGLLVETAAERECSVSAVQATRESQLPNYGAVGGQKIAGTEDLYRIEKVMEKPTPTEAEQLLHVPGLRAGHYLCFFGMHVFTPAVMSILSDLLKKNKAGRTDLSPALQLLSGKEEFLALENRSWRQDIGAKYGIFLAQLAISLSGRDRDEILSKLLNFMTVREVYQDRE